MNPKVFIAQKLESNQNYKNKKNRRFNTYFDDVRFLNEVLIHQKEVA